MDPPVEREFPNLSAEARENLKDSPAIKDGVWTLSMLLGPEAGPGRTMEEKGLPETWNPFRTAVTVIFPALDN
jgi:hypothetical protein